MILSETYYFSNKSGWFIISKWVVYSALLMQTKLRKYFLLNLDSQTSLRRSKTFNPVKLF